MWRYLSLAVAAITGATETPCSFPAPLDGKEVGGLLSAAATDAASCAAACCANATCQVWQWCAPGFSCAPASSCWVGALGGPVWDCSGWASASRPPQPPPGPLALDMSAPAPPPAPIPGMPPAVRADGSTLAVTSGGFLLNGASFFPVAGELHFTRVPPEFWARDLRLMRAGGCTVVSTYVFMIHHNEVDGVYEWGGRRNLTAFLDAAAAAGLLVSLRVGPYAHGEARGGGMPDWLQRVPGIALRSTQPLFMAYAAAWYAAVAAQLAGRMWQQGGPVLTIQLDNESSDGPYLMALRRAAAAAGIAPPFFASTGLNSVPLGSMLPLTGMYPIEFWDGGNNRTSDDYLFKRPDFEGSGYPTLWCELGAGIASVYCNRHRVAEKDIVASAYVAAARSSNLGYYMYSGGNNPLGALSTLQEQHQFYNGVWELPVLNYDFVAPLGQAGAVHAQYHGLRALHLLLNDPTLGGWLAPMGTHLPSFLPSGADDGATLRWAGRGGGNGTGGLLFFSTYARNLPFSAPAPARLALQLAPPPAPPLALPHASSPPLALPANATWAWAVLPPLPGGLRMAYATAQPAATLQRPSAGNASFVLLVATPGVAPELCFQDGRALRVLRCGGACTVEADGALLVRGVAPSRDVALEVLAPDGATAVAFVVLPPGDAGAGRLWVGELAGARRALLTAPGDGDTLVEFDGSGLLRLRLRVDGASGAAGATVSMLPAPAALRPAGGGAPVAPTPDGAFAAYSLAAPGALQPVAAAAALRRAGAAPPPPATKGGAPVAPGNDGSLAPPWDTAAVWDVALTGGSGAPPPGVEALELRLKLNYSGDAARLYASAGDDAPLSDLLGDHFFNAASDDAGLWRVGLTRALPAGAPLPRALTLRILGLRADAGAWLALDAWPLQDFGTGPNGSALVLHGVAVEATATVAWEAVE